MGSQMGSVLKESRAGVVLVPGDFIQVSHLELSHSSYGELWDLLDVCVWGELGGNVLGL